MSSAHDILHSVFGFSSFRPPQDQIIDALILGDDALVLMPTGGGKVAVLPDSSTRTRRLRRRYFSTDRIDAGSGKCNAITGSTRLLSQLYFERR